MTDEKLRHLIGERIADEVEKVAHGRQSNCEQAANDILSLLLSDRAASEARVLELAGALEPFAKVAGPIKGEAGRPTYLDLIVKDGGTEELAVTTIFDTGGRGAVLWADDFRRARSALNSPPAGGEE
jgi:hypothetical protein